ncbi:hypothetical protein L873DRAFT_1382875 [Choiromyces venosus 120613-1]|uniref:Retrotransposon gag domain-containing protein n=1 Tax=Choiromyces venosus 120613-1 TaxID=1336337 RepID=A0A3N4JM65_9PEZI|nr:hypothetical protein L873DRAFT_1382875 [Choiromyces venosus 120613-1]
MSVKQRLEFSGEDGDSVWRFLSLCDLHWREREHVGYRSLESAHKALWLAYWCKPATPAGDFVNAVWLGEEILGDYEHLKRALVDRFDSDYQRADRMNQFLDVMLELHQTPMQSLDDYVKSARSIAARIPKEQQDVLTRCFVKGIAHEGLRRLLATKCDVKDPFEKHAAEAIRIGHMFSTGFNAGKQVDPPLLDKNATTAAITEPTEPGKAKDLGTVADNLGDLVSAPKEKHSPEIEEGYIVNDHDDMAVDDRHFSPPLREREMEPLKLLVMREHHDKGLETFVRFKEEPSSMVEVVRPSSAATGAAVKQDEKNCDLGGKDSSCLVTKISDVMGSEKAHEFSEMTTDSDDGAGPSLHLPRIDYNKEPEAIYGSVGIESDDDTPVALEKAHTDAQEPVTTRILGRQLKIHGSALHKTIQRIGKQARRLYRTEEEDKIMYGDDIKDSKEEDREARLEQDSLGIG